MIYNTTGGHMYHPLHAKNVLCVSRGCVDHMGLGVGEFSQRTHYPSRFTEHDSTTYNSMTVRSTNSEGKNSIKLLEFFINAIKKYPNIAVPKCIPVYLSTLATSVKYDIEMATQNMTFVGDEKAICLESSNRVDFSKPLDQV